MISKKAKQKIMKHRVYCVARVVACVSFLALAVIGAASMVLAMSLETVANENGIPSVWKAASLGEPDSITVPIAYWDQKADDCDNPDRQFEWTQCEHYRSHGVLMGMVKPNLGTDGLPVPAFSDKEASWQALHDALSENVIGRDPVQRSDNFYRWFHEVPGLSKLVDGRTVTFDRTVKGVYTYGGQDVYPIDDVAGLDESDVKLKDWHGELHNFNFTAHLGFAIKVNASGEEVFEFSGDDDVWVFLNNKLVLDIGGLHGPISGWFRINQDGTVTTSVEKVNDLSIREGDWVECMRIRDLVYADQGCISAYNTKIRQNFSDVTTENIDFGLKEGDVVNLDFFYAERSTDGSNTKITVNHMHWPISADSELDEEVVGRIGETDSNLIEFNSSIRNRDPGTSLDIERIAAHIDEETSAGETSSGFLPLSAKTLFYSATPEDEDSWQPVEISAPSGTAEGFKLATPLRLAPAGMTGDTLYFRYFGETMGLEGRMSSVIGYYTSANGNAGVTYDRDTVNYKVSEAKPVKYTVTVKYLYEKSGDEAAPTHREALTDGSKYEVDSPEIEKYVADVKKIAGVIEKKDVEYIVYYKEIPNVTIPGLVSPVTPVEPEPEKPTPDMSGVEAPKFPVELEEEPTEISTPVIDVIGDELLYFAPLGEVVYVPNAGVVSDVFSSVFNMDFAEVVLSQTVVMLILLMFAGSFAVFFSLRKYANVEMAMAVRDVVNTKMRGATGKMPGSMKSAKSMKARKTAAGKSAKK